MATFVCDIEVHPAADLFPAMDDAEFNALVESIKAQGVRVPLVFFEGKLLDGKNRARAALAAGIPSNELPRRNVRADANPYEEAWALNATRRSLTPGQRATIRAEVAVRSGEWEATHAKVREEARAARSAAMAGNRNAAKNSPASHEARPGARDHKAESSRKTAARLAVEARVSRATMERSLRRAKGGAPPPRPRTPALLKSMPALATYLRRHLTSTDLAKLVHMITHEEKKQ